LWQANLHFHNSFRTAEADSSGIDGPKAIVPDKGRNDEWANRIVHFTEELINKEHSEREGEQP
jgi:hypothetical protein